MKRIKLKPRPDWPQQVEQLGMLYHTPDGRPYWDESACYYLNSREVDELEAATGELQRICLQAGQFIIDNNRFDDLRIPPMARQAIVDAWNNEPPSLYGRLDLSYDGQAPPKLLEYNADTPTALLEASVVQWHWRQEVRPATDQFNSIHEKLIAKWSELKQYLKGSPLYFTSMRDDEDLMTVTYLRDVAQQAGLSTEFLFVDEIGWNESERGFRDIQERPIESIFALYPWEWLLKDLADPILSTYDSVDWIEPIWKMMWSNKALLAILWEMFPGHPNLLEAHLDSPRGMRQYVKKPLLAREGANITFHADSGEFTTAGTYGEEGYVYQALARPAIFDGQHPVIGSWYVMDQGPAGIGIRESSGVITTNTSRFVPHYFD
ncbi:MAG: glutathionylspermidine synthase family protein [Acidobacteria bacterium]|nr:glutathionylspermidine synthase family protein [Acidobacteriota bacterium]